MLYKNVCEVSFDRVLRVCANSLDPIQINDKIRNWKNTKKIFMNDIVHKVYCRVKISVVISLVRKTIHNEV